MTDIELVKGISLCDDINTAFDLLAARDRARDEELVEHCVKAAKDWWLNAAEATDDADTNVALASVATAIRKAAKESERRAKLAEEADYWRIRALPMVQNSEIELLKADLDSTVRAKYEMERERDHYKKAMLEAKENVLRPYIAWRIINEALKKRWYV